MAVTNPYYEFTPAFVPGTKVRADGVNQQFNAVQAAFDILPGTADALTTGTATLAPETGSGDSFVVTMPETRTSYQDGDEVVFFATHNNLSSSASLEVDSLGTRTIVRADGEALAADDIQSGLVYVVRYDASNSRFQLIGPSTSYLTDVTAQATAAATSATNAASSAAVASTSEALAAEWAENAVDDDVTGSPGQYSALHWSSGAEAWASNAVDSAVATGFGGDGSTTFSAKHWSAAAQDWAEKAEDDPVQASYGGDGSTTFSAMHWALKAAASAVRGVVNADINTATPPTTEAVTGAYEIYDLADDDRLALFGFSGSNNLFVRNYMHAGAVYLQGEDSGGSAVTMLLADPTARVTSYYQNVAVSRTAAAASGGLEANNTSTGAGWERVLTESDAALALGIQDLTDPGADRIMFWDDSAGIVTWLTANAGLTTNGTDLNLDIPGTTLMPNTIDGVNDLLIMYDASVGIHYRVAIDDVANAGSGFVPASRTVTAGDGLTGGGDLSANITLDVNPGTGIAIDTDAVALSHLGFEDLVDPNADRIAFWDDSAGAFAWLTPGTSLAISGTSIDVTGLVIGTNVQAWDANLDELALIGSPAGADEFIVSSGAGAWNRSSGASARASLGANNAANLTTGELSDDRLSSNVPLLDAASNVFSGIVELNRTLPQLRYYESDQGVDEKYWIELVTGSTWALRAYDDTATSSNPAITATRTGTTVTSLNLSGTSITFNGGDLPVTMGGTGASTVGAAQQSLGVEVGVDVQAYDAGLDDISGLTPSDGYFIVGNGTNWVRENGTTARNSLGLGDMATQGSGAVSITGGSITGIADLALADGGTGASLTDPNADRIMFWDDSAGSVAWLTPGTSLSISGTSINVNGLVIGTNVQAWNAHLDDIAALGVVPGADRVMVSTAAGTWAYENGATLRTSLGLGTSDSPQFNAINVGHASDSTLTRAAAGNLEIEGRPILAHNDGALTSGRIFVQSGGSPSGGSNGDIFLIY